MALDTRIALGLQPIQQPNMLAQYGQLMALKAAQQETEGYEGVKEAITGGMSPTDPRMLQYGKRGIEAYKAAGEGAVKQQDVLAKSFANNREGLVAVRTPDDLIKYSVSQFSDPLVGPWLKSKGLTPDILASNLQKEIATSGFDVVLKKSAMGLNDFYKDQTSRRNTDVSAGPGYQQAQLAREKFEYDKANPELELVTGDTGFYGRNKRDPNSLVPLGMKPTAVPPPATQPSAVNNLMMTTQPTPSLNALAPTVPPQGAGPTMANAAAIDAQNNVLRPKQPVRQPVAVIKNGEVILVKPEEAVGMTPATPGAEKALEKTSIAKEGKESVNRVLGNLYSEYTNLVKTGGVTDTRRSVEENISARTGASAAGQLAGSFTGSEAQSFRDSIEQTRPLLLTSIMKATGLSATQLNSNVELQTYLKTATDPKMSIQSNVKALNNISEMFGLGEKFAVPEIPKAEPKTAAPSGASVTTPDGRTIVFPDAAAAAKFKKEAGL